MTENHIYYASSPYHHLLSLSIAANQSERATTHLISSPNFTNGSHFAEALRKWESSPFNKIHLFETPHPVSPPQVWFLQMRQVMKARQISKSVSPTRVYVAKDVEAAPQALMHYSPEATKISIEDGTAAYSTRVSNHPKKWKRPIRKVFYGYWYTKPNLIGGSKFIDRFAATFPDKLRPELDGLPTEQISSEILRGMDTNWMHPFFSSCNFSCGDCEQLDTVVLAAHSSVANNHPEYKEALVKQIKDASNEGVVGIKYHPRDHHPGYLDLDGVNATTVPSSVPAEIIYLQSPRLTTVIGTISTALMTARWLNEDIAAISLSKTAGIGNERVIEVMESVGIDVQ
ncbi:polysialyltransferase family glycosyltransferase [Halobacterium salinarum]|uniref:polysialyltransferase family glycosyltransferase n=1 Tax=Halobacterium salinarum TaxID=2242 RepID=UPI002554BBDB|nr:polysialyltransferase family glycosyltransferase [Halobacterium salinarum]MDL0135123.1 polysialyltransferase family glycosyltransferase [Halobacterium salinarum]